METVRLLYAEAYAVMDRAIAAKGSERQGLIAEAVRIHRHAVARATRLSLETVPPDSSLASKVE
jgi:hypothetical protein